MLSDENSWFDEVNKWLRMLQFPKLLRVETSPVFTVQRHRQKKRFGTGLYRFSTGLVQVCTGLV